MRDSTYRRDSIFVREYTRGDTVYIDRWRDRWQERVVERKDTVFIDRKEVVREKGERYVPAVVRWLAWLGGLTIAYCAARIGIKLIIKN